jgi:DNA-binding winged helix-turn-helix (wHTH) protein
MLQAEWQENMPSERVQFGQFVMDPDRYELTRAGKPVRMERIPMDLLLLASARKGKVDQPRGNY